MNTTGKSRFSGKGDSRIGPLRSVTHNCGWNEERDKVIERLRDFLKVNYVPATEVARSLKVRPETIYSWGQHTQRKIKRGKERNLLVDESANLGPQQSNPAQRNSRSPSSSRPVKRAAIEF
jgi:hypothetical protein